MSKMWYVYIYAMEYYSALDRKNTLAYAMAWMNLEDIRGEIS